MDYRKTGAKAQRELLLVDLFQPVEGAENSFKARRQVVSVEVSSLSGEPGKTLHIAGNFHAVGDQTVGRFSTVGSTFEAEDGGEAL